MDNAKKVLLTGITGFVGSHTAIQLLNKGYEVIGTVRDTRREASIRKVIGAHTSAIDNLRIERADLDDATVWTDLTRGVQYVQHIASPFPKTIPKDENELINPARNGNLNILKAAGSNGVKRVVITGSSSAITYGQSPDLKNRTYRESDWSDEHVRDDMTPYFKSKTIAEKAAWEFMKRDQSGLELSVVCPALILGPLLEEDFNASANVVIKLMDESYPALPKLGFPIVDVRSIASLLIAAMEQPKAANQRYIGSSGYLRFADIAAILKREYPDKKIPSREFPNWMMRFISNFDGALKPVILDLGVERKLDASKAVNELGWKSISVEEAVKSCAASLFDVGIIKH